MDADALRRALENTELKKYEAAAYLTLIEHGELAAVDVSSKSDIPTSQVYDTLRSLEERGFVETIDGERLRAKPREPSEMLAELRSRGSLLTSAADELEERWEQPDHDEHRVGVVKRPETVYERVRAQLNEAAVTAEFTMTLEQLELLLPELEAAAERGVFVRIHLYAEPDLREKAASLGLEDTALNIRVGTIPGPFLSIIDRHWLFFTPNTRADEDYGVLINDHILSFITHWYFVSCQWHMWDPLFDGGVSWTEYDSLEEFMRDVVPLFDDGADVGVEIHGNYIRSRQDCVVRGRLTGAFYPTRFASERNHLALEDLSSYATVFIDTGEETLSVGSWGAVYEDIEAHRISIESIDFPLDAAADTETSG
ncbi:transcriptional regulator TrmB [Halorubrum aidingense JCM 13560]|uniref:Transcriptional regulator TrmB n=1 Tax=Halorubrum aidingense JCM 13560 TaxID=1230454 RepID=M0PLN8_9EURY|nr:TrmB family transcriptional regulator sugar-binding domain-containing protein [Halorubrum aidingense]EMA70529.1 transcriptional regulator TrmB [Halorubrum aidingense JCM 13560]